MRIKFCLIIICLIIFGCKSEEKPVYVTRIGELTPGNGIPTLEVYVGKEDRYYIYNLWFPSGTDIDALPFFETVKIIGKENNRLLYKVYEGNDIPFYQLEIEVKSMELYNGNYQHYSDWRPPEEPPEEINE